MGIEFTLSDREFPASPAFVRFVVDSLHTAGPLRYGWPDQTSEDLWHLPPEEQRLLAARADEVMRHRKGRALVARAYELFVALLTAEAETLSSFPSRFHFIVIVGIPRTGGSYLTAELYRSLGISPYEVPHALAHDGFPEVVPYRLIPGNNSWITTLKSTAEYLTMVESFFAHRRCPHPGKIVVPKKLTSIVYAPGVFEAVFGSRFECILTVRHPVSCCVSTYEKSGGLPPQGRFAVRSNIEAWCCRDLEHMGYHAEDLNGMSYFEVYLHYWEQYYLRVVQDGLLQAANVRVVAYAPAALCTLAQHFHRLHQSGVSQRDFHIADNAQRRHPDWVEKSLPAIERVRAAWQVVGLQFPADDLAACA